MKNENKLTIPQWAISDRPREKFIVNGKSALSDTELIAILLRNGSGDESALDLAKRLLADNSNSLNLLADNSVANLTKIKGIGSVKAITLLAAFELGQRRRVEIVTQRKKISSATDILELMQPKLANLKHEEFWALYLNQAAALLRMENIGKGGLTSTPADVRLIMKQALELAATAIVICHNHPSGSLNPSQQDIQLTQQVKNAANIMNITLLDHVIIHKDNFYSFREDGIL